MIKPSTAVIKAVASFVPEHKLTNADLEKMVDTNDEWIYARTGIKERRIAPKDKPTSWMATQVAEKLLLKSGLSKEDVDGIIVATVTPDMFFPSTANRVASDLGLTAWSYDSLAACSGFIYALYQATAMVQSGMNKNVMVIGADKMSSIVDYTDRSTCILFGDAAAGVILSSSEDTELGIKDFFLGTIPDKEEVLYMKGGGSREPATLETVKQKKHYINQEGQAVYKKAVQTLSQISREILNQNNLQVDDIDWLVPHQANKRIIDVVRQELNMKQEKVTSNIIKYGNTTAATIPLCMADYEQQFAKGDNMIMLSFGGGFTFGACYLKWGY